MADAAYHRPTTLTDALALQAQGGLRVAAGCTDLFPLTDRKTLQGAVLDLTAIPELRGVRRTDTGLRIGATTTWIDLIRADLPSALDALKLAAREVGAKQIQNRGTIAGNLCNASPAADGVPPLLTLDARVELSSQKGRREMPLSDFLTGPRLTALAADELLTAVLIPASALRGQSHFLKLGARHYLIISIAMTAARIVIRDGVVQEAALAIGSCGPVATRLAKVERALIGHPPDPSRITDADVGGALSPMDDIRASAGYRSSSAAELLRRTVAQLAQGVPA